jgi:sugar lactone lactonase YvrE
MRVCALFVLLGLTACATFAPASPTILIPGSRIFPESITSTRRGDLIIGSVASGAIYRAEPGSIVAHLWIDPARSEIRSAFGVFADDAHRKLWVCSRGAQDEPPEAADRHSALRVFELFSGAPVAAYPMPGAAAATCNDIAVASDGAAFITDTRGGRVLRISPGGRQLEVWAADPRLISADGIAVDVDGAVVVTTVLSNHLYRIERASSGAAGAITELATSLPLSRPDGFRALKDGRFLLAESVAARVSVVTISGDRAELFPLGGVAGTTAVTFARGRVWAVDGKLAHRNEPASATQNLGAFELYSLALR